MVFDRFGREIPTECVLGLYLYQSSKAMCFLFQDGSTHWIPTSMILNIDQIDITNFEDMQPIEIAHFIVKNLELPIEY
jgi:hypothetical protein